MDGIRKANKREDLDRFFIEEFKDFGLAWLGCKEYQVEVKDEQYDTMVKLIN